MGNHPPPRLAELVLVTPDGKICGALPPVAVETPWWQDAEPLVRAVGERFGLEVVILRLLGTEFSEPAGGRLTYLAEVKKAVEAAPWHGTLGEHPLRLPYAMPGGPKAEMDWALSELTRLGITVTGAPQQMRTWNLSSVWRIPVEGQTVWLKSVPPFFAHEGPLLHALNGVKTPRLLAHQSGKSLLAEIAGDDLYGPSLAVRLQMISILVELQARWTSRVRQLEAMGLPDFRAQALATAVIDVISRTRPELSTKEYVILDSFATKLTDRFAAIAACRIPDTLVHGDFHPGNFRGDGHSMILLDWGDSGIGHPLLDQPAFLEGVSKDHLAKVRAHWSGEIVRIWPGSDPVRASRLLAPIAAARQAVIYRKFLDNIEPSEHVYHRADPARWLRRTAKIFELSDI